MALPNQLAGLPGDPGVQRNFLDLDQRLEQLATNVRGGIAVAARVRHSTAQTIATATLTVLSFDTELHDAAGLHDTATNNSRLTAPVPGIYAAGARISWGANATGTRQLDLRLNGSTLIARMTQDATATSAFNQQIHEGVELAVGDYIEVRVRQTSGGDLNVQSNASDPHFYMHRIGLSAG